LIEKMNMKRIIIVCVLASVVLMLWACGSGSSGTRLWEQRFRVQRLWVQRFWVYQR
jgi:ABC-type phosphate/phosphonate transport system substrate-binding protein